MKKITSITLALFFIELFKVQSQNSWVQKQNLGQPRQFAISFSIGTSGYVGTGNDFGPYKNDLWEYNSITGNWAQKASLGNGLGRIEAVGFSIGNKGYIGTGMNNNGAYLNDFWEYNPVTNTWIQKTSFAGSARWDATGFNIGNKGYIGGGSNNSGQLHDFWEYNPITDTWTQKSGLNINIMEKVCGFSIGNKGYMGNAPFYEYDPSVNTWTQKASYPGLAWYQAACFSIGGKGYVGTGENGITPPYFFKDFWEYNPISNNWTQKTDFGGTPRRSGVGFSIGAKGYIGLGFDTSGIAWIPEDLWEYTPSCTTPIATIYFSGNLSFCNGDSIFFYANNGYGYQWKKNGVAITGATSYFYYAKTAGSYTCSLSNTCGAVTSNSIQVSVSTAVPATPGSITTTGGSAKVCPGESRTYSISMVPGATSYTWTPCVGSTITSGQNTNSVTIQYNGNFPSSDSLRVVANNSCGSSAQRKLKISRNTPGTPSSITGDNYGVCNLSGKSYSVTNVSGMVYNWSFNTGMATVATGQGTSAITANFGVGYISGSISVTAANACGTSAARVKTIYAKPATPVAITGSPSVCLNQQDVPYSIAPLANVTNYTWTGPTGSHISDGSTTSAGTTLVTTAVAVTVDFATTAGTVKVRGNNACASGSYKSLSVAIVCREGNPSLGIAETRVYPNPATTDFKVETGDASMPFDLEIYDAFGRLVFSDMNLYSGYRVDASGWAVGLYSVVIRNENGKAALRLVIHPFD